MNSEPYLKGDFDNKFRHITNVKQQEDNPNAVNLDDLKWTYRKLSEYLYEEGKAPKNWVHETLTDLLKQRLVFAFNATRELLQPHPGTFAVYGADFIVDDNLNIWLTEIQKSVRRSNLSPSLACS